MTGVKPSVYPDILLDRLEDLSSGMKGDCVTSDEFDVMGMEIGEVDPCLIDQFVVEGDDLVGAFVESLADHVEKGVARVFNKIWRVVEMC